MIKLNKNNFLIYAIKHYDNSSCSGLKEFKDDLKRIKYIKKLLTRTDVDPINRCKLILNHIVILYNVFGSEATPIMLFYSINSERWSYIKTIFVYLNIMPDKLHINDNCIVDSDIKLDEDLVNILRKI